jgi:FKBP-type peptidyl-prolyl cis-trans isomerase
MKIGGMRKLTIPTDLAYGEAWFPRRSSQRDDAGSEVELLGVG